jgi:predicted AlkP superfamily pyrophosphatase or phosphodiesterase
MSVRLRRWRPGRRGTVAIVVVAVLIGFMIPMPAAVPTGGLIPDGYGRALMGAATDHVVVVSIDGLRPDAIHRFGATEMLRLMGEGQYATGAVTVLPSNTIPSHTSMLTGVEPGVHGVNWNDRASVLLSMLLLSDRRRRVPTVFEFADQAGLSSAAVMAKSQMRQLTPGGALDHVAAPIFPFAHIKREWDADRVVAEAESYLIADRAAPNLLFVHLADPDLVGHEHGWMTEEYGAAVRTADRALARILAAADAAYGIDGYAVIVTSDHGGVGRGHGGADPREVRIPFIIAGRGVEPRGAIERPVRIADTAATALSLIGLPLPPFWTGSPIEMNFGRDRS